MHCVALSSDDCDILYSPVSKLAGWIPTGGKGGERTVLGADSYPQEAAELHMFHLPGTQAKSLPGGEEMPSYLVKLVSIYFSNIFLCGSHIACFSSMNFLLTILY